MPDGIRTAPDWEDIRYFAALAEHRTLSATARHLRVNHATVSRRIGNLEAALGLVMFDRRPDGYLLTAAGQELLGHAQAMKQAALHLHDHVGSEQGLTGTVRLTMARVLADGFLVPRLGPLRERLPDIDIELIVESRLMSLARHEADLALRFGDPKDSALIGRRVGRIAFAFYVGREHQQRLAEYSRPPLVGFDQDSEFVSEAAWMARRFAGHRFAFRSNGQISQMLAVKAGFGIGLLPRYVAEQDAALISIPFGDLPPSRDLWLLMRREVSRLPRVRAVADEVVAILEADADLIGR